MIRSRFLLILFSVSFFLLFHSSLLMSIKKQLPFNFRFIFHLLFIINEWFVSSLHSLQIYRFKDILIYFSLWHQVTNPP